MFCLNVIYWFGKSKIQANLKDNQSDPQGHSPICGQPPTTGIASQPPNGHGFPRRLPY